MLGSDVAVEGRRIVLLPETALTTAVTDVVTTPLEGAGIKDIVAQCLFSYGSGGTGADFFLQTSLDRGVTWTDIAAFRFPGVEGRLARDFDGSSDYYALGSDLTGNANGKLGTLSMWVRLDGGDGANMRLLHGKQSDFYLERTSSNKFFLRARDVLNVTTIALTSDTSVTASSTWRNILLSWDSGNNKGYLYLDDTDDEAAETIADLEIDYTQSDYYVGSSNIPDKYFNGAIAELYFALEYIDFSVAANRRKFISAAGLPVALGADGSLPTGNQPILYLPAGDGTDNKGSGGNFTAQGSPTSIAGPNSEETRFQAMKHFTPVAANQSIQDGALTANTILDGVLGDRFRIKYSTTGTFVNTTIKIDAVVKA